MSNRQDSTPGVSVIGLGAMGSGIARTLVDRGCRVSVWNRTRAKVDELVSNGAIGCDGPGDALDAHTHVVVCLSDYAVWQRIIEAHDLASHFENTCIIQLTTGTIDDVQAHASLIKDHGGRLVDGAVMCYPRHLGTDEASLLLSGAPDVLQECAPFLSLLDANWTNLGEDINRPSVLSRSLMAGLTGAMMGLVNGAAICRAGGVPLDVFMKFNEGTNSILLAEQRRLIEAIRDGRTEETEASIKAWREGKHERGMAQPRWEPISFCRMRYRRHSRRAGAKDSTNTIFRPWWMCLTPARSLEALVERWQMRIVWACMSAAVVLLILSAPVQADTGILIQEAKTELRELTKTQLDLESEILALDGRLIEAEKDYSWEHDGVFLLKKASDRAQQSGLEVRRFERLDPVPLAHHVEDRVALELYGGFHHIVRYLDELAQLRRIVYVRDLKLSITEFIGEEAMVTANAELVAIHRAEWEGERGALLPVGSVEDAISDPELLLGEYRRVIEETQTRVETVGVIRDARTAGLNNHRLLQLHRSHLVHVLDAIAQASPEKMRILGLQQDGQGLVLEGRSSSNDVLASFLHNLDQSPYLDEVYLSAVEQILEDGIKVKSYRASLKLVTPESSMTRTDQATIEAIDHLLETRAPYRYDPYGKSDPFDLFLVPETGSEGATAQTPLQRFLLQDMELVGVIVTLHRASGLVADPTGMVHRVEVGDYLGTAWGQVVEVGQEFIVVEEEFQSADGDLLVTQKHLGIHSEAEPTDNPDRRIDLTFSGDVHGLVRMLGPHLGINLAVSGDLERQIHLVLRGVDWVTGFSTLLERNGLCVQNFESTYVIRDRYEGREGCQPEVTTELAVTREWQGEPTNYDFVQADIREVFQLFTHQSELAFQFPEAVQASISFHLQGGSWEEAAATLLFVQDLEAEKKRKTWKIHAP